MKIEYRLATPADIKACVRIRGKTRENAIAPERLASMGITQESWADEVQAEILTGYVCCFDGEIVGYCFGDTSTGEVVVLALLPEAENQGVGKLLLSQVVRALTDKGFKRLFLGCSADPAVRSYGFYRHLGWRPADAADSRGDEVLEYQVPAIGPAVKICCISSAEEARIAVGVGAHAVGLVSAMPSGPGVIDDALIATIAAGVPAPVQAFLLTSRQTAAGIIEQHRRCRTTTLQLVDHVPFDELARLRQALPGVRLVQVIHVTGAASVDKAVAVAPLVDAVLLDSGNPGAAVKELGGTGRVHDWAISRRIRDALAALGRPMYLAGGLTAGNVAAAVAAVQPFGLDLCSSVRSHGQLDAVKLAAFFAAVPPLPPSPAPTPPGTPWATSPAGG